MYKSLLGIQFVLGSVLLLMEFSFYDSDPLVYFIYKIVYSFSFTCYILLQLYLVLMAFIGITQIFTFFDWLGCSSDSA